MSLKSLTPLICPTISRSFINRGHEAFSTEPVKNGHNASGKGGSASGAGSGAAAAMGAGVASQLNFYYIQNVSMFHGES